MPISPNNFPSHNKDVKFYLSMASKNLLIIASSETNADLHWATHFVVPDPVIFIQHKKKRYLILSDLELERGKKEASVDHVFSYSTLENNLKKKRPPQNKIKTSAITAYVLKKLGVRSVTVPCNFPHAQAVELQKLKIKIQTKKAPFFEERALKTDREKLAIKKTLRATSLAILEAYRILRISKIKGHRIYYRNQVLTSELLKKHMHLKLMELGCTASHTIVASGQQAAEPHCEGHGPILPHQFLVIDVFPRSMDTGYFGDMSRTVVKGKATNEMKKMWKTVKQAQENAIQNIKSGAQGQKIHQDILKYFTSQGYASGKIYGKMQGFIHGTGHGLGLEIHEHPRISKQAYALKSREVVTVEPGLYYRDRGGVRIEDVVFVTKNGCEVLSKCPKILEIP